MEAPAKTVGLLHLPPEIRNQIYHHALSSPRGICLNTLQRPALASTCRQIQQETLPIFFRNNRFDFHLSRPLQGQDANMLLQPNTAVFLENCGGYMEHIVAVNVYATIRYKLCNGFFTVFRIRVLRSGRVCVDVDVDKLVGGTRLLCVGISLALEEWLHRSTEVDGVEALGLRDLETVVDVFRPHVLDGRDIWLGSGKEVQQDYHSSPNQPTSQDGYVKGGRLP